MNPEAAVTQPSRDQPAPELLAAYFGERRGARHYLAVFESFGQQGHGRMSWNWAAFFFGSLWLFYRGMFGYAIGYLVLVGFGIPLSITAAPQEWAQYVALLLYGVVSLFVLPAFADWLYYRKVCRDIDNLRRKAVDQADLIDRLHRKPRQGWIGLAVLATIVGGCMWVSVTAYRDVTIRGAVADAKSSFDEFYLPGLEAFHREHGRWPRSSAEMPPRPTGLARPSRSLAFVSEGRFEVVFGKPSPMADVPMFITVRWQGEKIRSRCEIPALAKGSVPWMCREESAS